MTYKDHGYYGYAYLGARITQAIALLPILGITGTLISLIAKSKHTPPSELVATEVFSAMSLLWILLSITAYHDTHIPYLATVALDTTLLIPFIVFAVVIGQPLSLTTCSDLPKNASHVALPITNLTGQPVSYVVFSGAGQTVCYDLMAVWGLMIALCILFVVSAASAWFLYLGKRRANPKPKGGKESKLGMGGMFPGGGGYPGMNESQMEMANGKGYVSRSPSIGGPAKSGSGTGTPARSVSPVGSEENTGPARSVSPPSEVDGPVSHPPPARPTGLGMQMSAPGAQAEFGGRPAGGPSMPMQQPAPPSRFEAPPAGATSMPLPPAPPSNNLDGTPIQSSDEEGLTPRPVMRQ